MKKMLFYFLFLSPFFSIAQDFTMEGGYTDNTNQQEASLLIIPFHTNHYLSEIDGLLAQDSDLDAIMIRRKLRRYLAQSLDQQFADSMDTRNLLIGEQKMLDYIYNGVSYRYVQYDDSKEEGLTWLQKKLQKKDEPKVYGRISQRQEGQLVKEELNYDRYMSVDINNEGMAEYLHDEYSHSHMLFINELEMRRNLEKGQTIYGDTDYTITVHYSIMKADGTPICGGKVSKEILKADTELKELTHHTFNEIALQIISEAYVYLGTVESTVDQAVED